MKRLLGAILLLLLALPGCASPEMPPVEADEENAEAPVVLEQDVWPENPYTDGLPVPAGTVCWVALDEEQGNCAVSLTDVAEADYDSYRERLDHAGFSVAEEASEVLRGQDAVSVGTLLSDGEKALSISYLSGGLTVYITFTA